MKEPLTGVTDRQVDLPRAVIYPEVKPSPTHQESTAASSLPFGIFSILSNVTRAQLDESGKASLPPPRERVMNQVAAGFAGLALFIFIFPFLRDTIIVILHPTK